MSIRIIIDSTTDLREEYLQYVTVVPLKVRFGEEEFEDGVTISKDTFYKKLIETDVLPQTSQASPADFEKHFEEVRKNQDQAIVFTLSSKLSGTYQSACIAADDYENIVVIDTNNVAVGAGILVEYAINLQKRGLSLDEIVAKVIKKRDSVCLLALLDTLEYLKMGGRISKTVAIAGGLLNIKPVITVKDGAIELIGKARGSKQGNNFLINKVQEFGVDYNMPILLGYSGLEDHLLQKYVEDSQQLWVNYIEKLNIAQVCSVIGTHVGPGAIVVAFFQQEK